MSTVSRAEYEAERARVLMAAGQAATEDEARRLVERSYPKSTSSAIDELLFRGLDCSEWKALDYCRTRPELAPPIVGGSRVWGKQHIDDFAEVLESHGKLLPSAIYRKELGLSWSEERALRRRLEAERKEAAHAE